MPINISSFIKLKESKKREDMKILSNIGKPFIKIYILCYNKEKLDFAIKKYENYYWAYPILMKYQDFTFENAFWKQLLEIKEEWINCEMVGTLSYKSFQKINLDKINTDITNRKYKNEYFYPFYKNDQFIKLIDHPMHIYIDEIWDYLLTEFNYNDCLEVYCNYWICTPFHMLKFIEWFHNLALPKLLMHPLAMTDANYNGKMSKEDLLKLTGYPYYPMVPFVLERFNPCFFYNFQKNIIPILIICYNNYKYVENTIQQLISIDSLLCDIIIVNNNSNDADTLKYLDQVKLKYLNEIKIINNESNNGPWINYECNTHIYDTLPDKFILTDPDLQFNENLPKNFIEEMIKLSDKYNCQKIGFALDISDHDKMFTVKYVDSKTIYEWEEQFWKEKITNENYELYRAQTDTTFCLVNKNGDWNNNMRIANNFTCKHLPWYKENKIYNIYENYLLYKKQTKISTMSKIFISYIEKNYLQINKNNELILIENNENDTNLNFWKNIYSGWEYEKFQIFDKYLDKNKILIDIGGWIGTTCIYGSRKSKEVFVVDADKLSFIDLTKNCKLNCDNVTLINNAIYNEDDTDIFFGPNQIVNSYLIKTITIESLIKKYNIDPFNISLIKVDIEGGEENILNDLFQIKNIYNIPLYISFHLDLWKDKNLNRFSFLTEEQKHNIYSNPLTSILFDEPLGNVFIKLTSYNIVSNDSKWYHKNVDTGLGNMLFQIASGLAFGIKNNAILYVPNLNTYFKLEELVKEDTIFRKINTDVLTEYNDNNYIRCYSNPNKNIHEYTFENNICLFGYFENYLNFDDLKPIILDYFSPQESNINYIINKYPKIKEDGSCSIHIRGSEKWLNFFQGNNMEKYINSYVNCINYMIDTKNIKTLFVMSNDRKFSETVVDNFKNKLDIIYTNEVAYIDIWMISLIKNNIASCSTLSFWGIYLNKNEDKFVVSNNYFRRNFFLPDWILID